MDIFYFNSALQQYNNKNYKIALDYLEKGEVSNSQNDNIKYLLGTIYLKFGEIEKAKQKFEEGLKIDNGLKRCEILLKLSTIYKQKNNKQKQKQCLDQAKEIDINKKRDKEISFYFANYYYDEKQYIKALENVNGYEDRSFQKKKAECLNKLKNYTEADEIIYKLLISGNDKEKADCYITKSKLESERAQFDKALKWINEAIKIDGKNISSLIYKIIYLYNLNKFQEAIKLGEKIKGEFNIDYKNQMNFQPAYLFLYLACCERKMENYIKFEEYIQQYLLISNNWAKDILLELFSCYQDKEEYKQAEQYLKQYSFPLNSQSILKIIEGLELIFNKIKTKEKENFMIEGQTNEIKYQNKRRKIGQGGFAEIWYEIIEGNEYAVKYYKKGNFFEELRRELYSMIDLDHPNLIKLRGFIDNKLLMEYADGGDLKELLKKNKDLPIKFKIFILKQIAEGLRFLKEKGIIHCDIKAKNILLKTKYAENKPFPIPKIGDFGGSTKINQKNSIQFTPNFTAPEIWESQPCHESDIFSYGMMIYEILSQVTPFKNLSQQEIKMKICGNEKPDMSLIPSSYPCELKRLFFNCIKPGIKERITIIEIINELQQIDLKI